LNKKIVLVFLVAMLYMSTIAIDIQEAEAKISGKAELEHYSKTETKIKFKKLEYIDKNGKPVTITDGEIATTEYNKHSASIEVKEIDPVTESFCGSFDSSKSWVDLGAGNPIFLYGNVSVSGSMWGSFNLGGYLTDFNFLVSGPSIDFLGGIAETGPWTAYRNTTVPFNVTTFVFDLNSMTGWYNVTYIVVLDTPNIRIDGSPINMPETVWGSFKVTPYVPVGGISFLASDRASLPPYIGLASTILIATVATAVYVKRVKRRKEKQ